MIYPRLRHGGHTFRRDIYAVTGIWVSLLALSFLFTGLPWAKSWGGYLELARRVSGKAIVHEDWTTGRSSEIAQRLAMNKNGLAAISAGHTGSMGDMTMGSMNMGDMNMASVPSDAYTAIDKLIASVASLHLAFPVLISPPMRRNGPWTAKSDSQDRVLRDQVTLDAATGAVLTRLHFSQRPLINRMVGIGIAAHEGHLYGWLNQIVNLGTALGLITLSVSAIMLWWRRRPKDVLGAPLPNGKLRFTAGLVALTLALAIYLPLFGLSLLLVGVIERFVLRRLSIAHQWLGLGKEPV